MPKRIQLRRFHRGERQVLLATLKNRKLPVWMAQRYRLIAWVYAGLSALAAARRLGCAKETAYRWIEEFNRRGFRGFNRTSNPAGRPSRLTPEQLTLLCHIAQKRPTDVGLPFTNGSMTKLQEYLIKKHHFPKVSPEWLRRLLHRAKISWQRTKTWKQSTDPEFQSKKSAFWNSGPTVRRMGSWSVTINGGHWNSAPWRGGAGLASAIRSGIAPRTPESKAWSNCTASTRSMRTAWLDVSANRKRPRTSWPVSNACANAIRCSSAFI